MAHLEQGTWVLIADGEKALILENQTDHENPYFEVRREEHHENPPTREQGAHKPGRMSDTGVGQRSALEDTDWHKLEKERFAEELSELLYKRAHQNAFKSIVLVASPRVLGDLRSHLHKEVQGRVIGEVPKTLTNHPVDEIEQIVKGELDAA
ncbi:host attachment family protein [Roseicyclus sp. F158]|uniref:Host attachment family protein n=1 Tax=Tropicimonas omnivorans TaxID=3075590 RepID=A0ABU3DIE4_9RHOB|nr:host attachment family protein [Roseicyclus sp. F158]MDT0683484.1 host attachment family protein [Roseicyclus sp. F158]